MDIRERQAQLQQAHAQHVQLLQQTQANIIRLEGALEMLNEQIAEQDAVAVAPAQPNRKARRASHLKLVEPPAEPPVEPAIA